MAVSILGTPAALDETTNNSYTPETGADLVVAIFVTESTVSTRTLTSAVLGGVTMTVGHSLYTNNVYVTFAYLKQADIPVGSSAWAATWSGAMSGDEGAGVIFSLQGVDQTTPIGNTSGAGFSSSSTPSDSITSADGSIVLGACVITTTSAAWTGPTGSFTEQREANDPSGGNNYRFAIVDRVITTGAAESWGYTLPATKTGAIASMVVLQSAGGPSIPVFMHHYTKSIGSH